MGRHKLVVLLFFITLGVLEAQRDYIPAVPVEGLELLDWFRGGLYVSGRGAIFEVNEFPRFNISYFPYFNPRHYFLDFKTFEDHGGNPWAIGTVPNNIARNSTNENEFPGMNYPFALSGSAGHNYVEIVEHPPGYYLMHAVAVDNSTENHHIAYLSVLTALLCAVFCVHRQNSKPFDLVGWHQHFNASGGVNFTVIRTIVNITRALATPPIFPVFQYDPEGVDRVYLHGEDFVSYTGEFNLRWAVYRDLIYNNHPRPWLFHSVRHWHLIVVDPATNSVFRVFSPLNTSEPLYYNHTNDRIRIPFEEREGGAITGATYDAERGHLFLGLAGLGSAPGRILVLDVVNMTHVRNFSLGLFESNPKGLTLDAYGPGANATHLYVGLYGNNVILKINLRTWHVTWLQNVFAVTIDEGARHVYFITYEQQAKVGRVATENFCEFPCDSTYGWCNNTRCVCPPFMRILPDRRCEYFIPTPAPTPAPTWPPTPAPTWPITAPPTWPPTPAPPPPPSPLNPDDKLIKKEKGGEVALGILFAIVFVLAAVGWYLLYKARGGRGAYEVLESKGLINRNKV